MVKIRCKNTLLISNSLDLKTSIKSVLPINTSLYYYKNVKNSLLNINITNFSLVILDDNLRNDTNFKDLIREIISEYLAPKTIVIIKDDNLNNIYYYAQYGITCILERPIRTNLLKMVIMQKLGLIKQSDNTYIKHHGISIYPNLNYIILKGCKIYLSKCQTDIMIFLLTNNNPCNSRGIVKYLSCCKDKNISQSYLSANISKLRNKFIKNTGLKVIKNRRGFGYYISI